MLASVTNSDQVSDIFSVAVTNLILFWKFKKNRDKHFFRVCSPTFIKPKHFFRGQVAQIGDLWSMQFSCSLCAAVRGNKMIFLNEMEVIKCDEILSQFSIFVFSKTPFSIRWNSTELNRFIYWSIHNLVHWRVLFLLRSKHTDCKTVFKNPNIINIEEKENIQRTIYQNSDKFLWTWLMITVAEYQF